MKWFHKIQQTLQTYDYMYLKQHLKLNTNIFFNKLHILFKWGKCVTIFYLAKSILSIKKVFNSKLYIV